MPKEPSRLNPRWRRAVLKLFLFQSNERNIKMPDHHVTVCGTVTAVFAHRFVIESEGSKHLADIGPEAVELVHLKEGDKVEVSGERKPSEIKVTEIVKTGGEPVRIEHKKKKHDHDAHHAYQDPKAAIVAVTQHGFKVIAEPRRKPKHFEILGRSAKGQVLEFHVELDGAIRKRKPADPHESKWRRIGVAE
jgi:formyltetrahydrofolate synthetase